MEEPQVLTNRFLILHVLVIFQTNKSALIVLPIVAVRYKFKITISLKRKLLER